MIGTLLGTMFGFVSSAVLSEFLGEGILPAMPGVVSDRSKPLVMLCGLNCRKGTGPSCTLPGLEKVLGYGVRSSFFYLIKRISTIEEHHDAVLKLDATDARAQVIGSSMGVLATYFAGEGGSPLREILYKSARSVGAALALTVIYASLFGPVMPEVGAEGLVWLGKLRRIDQSSQNANLC